MNVEPIEPIERITPHRIAYKQEPKYARPGGGWHQITRVLFDGRELEGMILTKKGAGREPKIVMTCFRGTCRRGHDVRYLLESNRVIEVSENPVPSLRWQHDETVNGRKSYVSKTRFGIYRVWPSALSKSYSVFWEDSGGLSGQAGKSYKIASGKLDVQKSMDAAARHAARLTKKMGSENPTGGQSWGVALLLLGGLAAAGVAAYALMPKSAKAEPGPVPQVPGGKLIALTQADAGKMVNASVGDVVQVQLYPLDPSTGYRWGVEFSGSGMPVVAVDADASDPEGRFVYSVIRAGRTVLRHVPVRGSSRGQPLDFTIDVQGQGTMAGSSK